MKNILLKVEYDGTNYKGWQSQSVKNITPVKAALMTVQQTIENAISTILQKKITLIGSGRTDAKVHAKEQIANFKAATDIPLKKLKKSLNSLLPDDIIIKSIKEVSIDFHSRFSAKTKLYRYSILNREHGSAFSRDNVLHYALPLNVKLMQKEAKVLKGKHDFKSFQASDKKIRPSVRTIKNIKIKKYSSMIYIDIEADGFLYNMVRNIVGTLIEIGRGKMNEGSMKKILHRKDRTKAGPTAPARGLCLIKVRY